MSPETEGMLIRVLSRLDGLPDAMVKASQRTAEDAARFTTQEQRNADFQRRIEALERADQSNQAQSNADLREQLRRAQDNTLHWSRYVITALVALATSAGLLLLAKYLTK